MRAVIEASSDLFEARKRLQDHALYGAVRTIGDLRRFTEFHVFAVWDFMTLLKSLQRELTSVSLPWSPPRDPEAARLVNELVLAEESDAIGAGANLRHLSHFAWYLEAMTEIGADRTAIDTWVDSSRRSDSLRAALGTTELVPAVGAFLSATADTLDEPLPVRAATFHQARESIIPEMFLPIADQLAARGFECATLLAYLRRHVDVDSQEHAVASEQMVARLLEGSPELASRADAVSVHALSARAALWDAILEAL
ncbi:MAG: DUF3050 domain-containing protein [Myxococcota bacterium]|nr:DUF3050 domain-containing protein [Myxococcota bacterium]